MDLPGKYLTERLLPPMARVAITGSNGFVGGNIARVLQMAGYEVIGIVRSAPTTELPWQTRRTDLSDISSITESLQDCDAVVHCAIANDFNRLQEDRPFAYDSFVGLTQRITHAANATGSHMIYISTGWVVDGTGHKVPETDCGNPVNFYGALKSLGEQVIRDLAPQNGAIVRVEGVMGKHQTQEQGPRTQDVGFGYFVTSLVADLRAGKTFTVFGGERVNKITTPVSAAEIGAQVERIVSRKAAGTFHVVSDDAVGRMEYARMVCDVFELDASLLREADPPADQLFPGAVPVDSSLGNTLTKKALGLGDLPLRQMLQDLRNEIDNGKLTFITQPERA
jgi:dTDP-4-dehydrorhamnose reductase